MKQITITVPDNCELKQDGNTYTVVEKEKLTYEDVARELFYNKSGFYITAKGYIYSTDSFGNTSCKDATNCTSPKQAEKLLAINKLMNVAKYLNGDWQPDWQPDWNNGEEDKYYIQIETLTDELHIDSTNLFNRSIVYFKSRKLANKAIEILGEETIRLALCTDY